jgi:hypothetical protein
VLKAKTHLLAESFQDWEKKRLAVGYLKQLYNLNYIIKEGGT